MTMKEAAEKVEDVTDDSQASEQADEAVDNNEAAEKPETPQRSADDISVEERARAMGWRPKEEYGGNKDNWVDANEFVRKGEEELPVMRDTVRRLTREVVESKKIFEKAQRFQESAHKREVAAYERELGRVRKEKLQAVELGDTDAYTRLEKEETELRSAAPEVPAVEAKTGLAPEVKAEIDKWAASNPWFMNDKELNVEMVAAFGVVENLHPAATIEDKLRMSRERVAKLHPAKFGNPNRARPGSVETGTARTTGRTGKTYDDLPSADKRLCDDFVRRGVMTREKYVKQYDWEEK